MLPEYKHICVMGLGYVGLPTATIIASCGVKVTGVDTKQEVVDTINQGNIHIVEPDLDGLVAKVVQDGTLHASTQPSIADAFIITVPTPITKDKKPDMSYVNSALRTIAPSLRKGNLVIIESTSPVGTTQDACELLASLRKDLSFPHDAADASDVRVAYCPERVLPGHILTELTHNDRTIGGITPLCAMHAASLYHIFVRGTCHTTNAPTAELVKLSENAYRDVNIAYANELANICMFHNLDENDVIRFANLHPRVNILSSGPGVGGHCIPVDPWFIADKAPQQSQLIRTARTINDDRPRVVAQQVLDALKPHHHIACLGLSYKPDIDDLRESPAIDVVSILAESMPDEAQLYICEPHIKQLPESLQAYSVTFTDALLAIEKSDVIVTLVNHRNWHFISKDALKDKMVFDFAGVWKS